MILGLGGTIDDEILWDEQLLQRLAAEYGIRRTECDATLAIRDERSLVAVILGFAIERRGGERFVESFEVIERFSARHEKTVTLGGTGVRAALVMRKLGVRSTVHLVSIDDAFRRLFPADCDYISSATTDGMFPHLIIQLPERGRIELADGEVLIEGPNRLIFVNDPPHVEIALSPDLAPALRTARWLLLSGLNSMNDIEVLSERLRELRAATTAMPSGGLIMYEDAGFHAPRLHRALRKEIASLVDVYSMNEDELQAQLGRRVELLDPAAVVAALRDVRALIPGPTLVVHTRHWALAWGADAPRFAVALGGGIAAATARYVHGDELTAERVAAIGELDPPIEHRLFCEGIVRDATEPAVCVPAYVVSVEHPITIGLGDCFVGGFLAALAASETTGEESGAVLRGMEVERLQLRGRGS
jgi:sugar/nucleoside kinase (ribokinase family)